MEIDENDLRSLCSIVTQCRNQVRELLDRVEYLDAEVIALGNILIRKNIMSLEEIKKFTEIVMKQKTLERQKQREQGIAGAKVLRNELEEALSAQIIQDKK